MSPSFQRNGWQDVEHSLQQLGERPAAQRLLHLAERWDNKDLHVVVFGEFNRGKSTFINALLGRVVLPARLVPTTGHVTRVTHDSTEEVRVRFNDGRLLTCPLSQLDAFVALGQNGRVPEEVAEIEVAVACPLLRDGLVLVDTPGINEQEAQTRRAREAITQADLVLLVLDARQMLGRGESDLASDWLRRELGKPVALVVNFLNLIDPTGLPDLRARLDRWCRAHLANELGKPWFAVNALGALRAALGHSPAPTDDFVALRDALVHCRGPARRHLQQHSRRGQLLAEVRQLRRDNEQTLRQIRADAAQVERDRAEQRNRLHELRRRLGAAAQVVQERLTTRACQELDRQLEALTGFWFRGEGKQRLEQNANRWYQERLFEAVRSIEKEADARLAELAGDFLQRPEALTLGERMALNARIDVGDLPLHGASGQAIGWGAGLGAAAGTFLLPIPVLGTAAGAVVGGWLANWLGSSEPDYVAAYAAQARSRWADHARQLLATLQGQFDGRVSELQRQIDERLQQVQAMVLLPHDRIAARAQQLWEQRGQRRGTDAQNWADAEAQLRAESRTQPLAAELLKREALATALAHCERELQAAGTEEG